MSSQPLSILQQGEGPQGPTPNKTDWEDFWQRVWLQVLSIAMALPIAVDSQYADLLSTWNIDPESNDVLPEADEEDEVMEITPNRGSERNAEDFGGLLSDSDQGRLEPLFPDISLEDIEIKNHDFQQLDNSLNALDLDRNGPNDEDRLHETDVEPIDDDRGDKTGEDSSPSEALFNMIMSELEANGLGKKEFDNVTALASSVSEGIMASSTLPDVFNIQVAEEPMENVGPLDEEDDPQDLPIEEPPPSNAAESLWGKSDDFIDEQEMQPSVNMEAIFNGKPDVQVSPDGSYPVPRRPGRPRKPDLEPKPKGTRGRPPKKNDLMEPLTGNKKKDERLRNNSACRKSRLGRKKRFAEKEKMHKDAIERKNRLLEERQYWMDKVKSKEQELIESNIAFDKNPDPVQQGKSS